MDFKKLDNSHLGKIVRAYIRLIKIKAAENLAKFLARSVAALISLLLILLGFALLNLALSFYLGEIFNHPYLGFIIVSGINFGIAIVLWVFSKRFVRLFLNFFIRIIFN